MYRFTHHSLLALALLGLFGATSIGYASYVVSRDSVGLPVTKLDLSERLAPAAGEPIITAGLLPALD